jgi:hypothetical protein
VPLNLIVRTHASVAHMDLAYRDRGGRAPVLWASPFGPASDLASAARWLVFGYPAWFLLSLVWLVPGIVLVGRIKLNSWWILPGTATLIQLLIGAAERWPPTRWWPVAIVGQIPAPSAYVFSIPVEAWHNYFYSLWPKIFNALIAALSLLVVQRVLRPNQRLERTRGVPSLVQGGKSHDDKVP